MRKLLFIITIVLLASCGTEPQDCDTYLLTEHNYYQGQGYSVFVNESDSIGVELTEEETSIYKVGNRYELCFEDGNVILN